MNGEEIKRRLEAQGYNRTPFFDEVIHNPDGTERAIVTVYWKQDLETKKPVWGGAVTVAFPDFGDVCLYLVADPNNLPV
jgi:hypothetical protein